MINSSFTRNFITIGDQRQCGKIRHNLFEVIFIAVAGFIARSEDWVDIYFWAEERIDWLRKYCELPYGIPSISTFQRIFRMIDPKQFEKCFIAWTREVAEAAAGRNIAIDGKSLRGARETGLMSPVHIVSAWCNYNGLTLGEVKTSDKSNEITAIPELLALLAVEGCIITIDAMGAQTDIAERIVNVNHADYVLGLKQNQPATYADAVLAFLGVDFDSEDKSELAQKAYESALYIENLYSLALSSKSDIMKTYYKNFPDLALFDLNPRFVRSVEKGHGRIEKRLCFLFSAGSWMRRYEDWTGLKSIGVILNSTINIKTGAQSFDYHFFLTTLEDVRTFARSARSHWEIEACHWVLDVVMGEDKSRIRKENEPQNVAVIRKIVRNLVGMQRTRLAEEQNKTYKQSYKSVRFRSLLNENFLEQVMIENIMNQ